MSFVIVTTQEADDDLIRLTKDFAAYSVDVAERFVDEIQEVRDRILLYPYGRPEILPGIRGANLRKFRFEVWYRILEAENLIEVLGVRHHRQDRDLFSRRLD